MNINDCWHETVKEIFGISASFGSILRSARLVDFSDGNLKLEVNYKFHKDKIEDNKNKTILETTAEKFFQNKVKLNCCLSEVPVEVLPIKTEKKSISGIAEEMFG